ncbi:Oidioi.mRNA.OKI2018_I69.chr1.g2657.t1.cds [Oikopleura dioica]|uniref:Oidioi.mRNA.OKI2018_I69.chr1.g2657.t1.cds n=1 Tax=Oikopleura dioica TaxID=34765 RepID=A0ABN7SX10_OIKDI|nr:Oidioi.mRNA.OKI2018_I69.chr1.g2657.t1.cds [Oikopleura dioica]
MLENYILGKSLHTVLDTRIIIKSLTGELVLSSDETTIKVDEFSCETKTNKRPVIHHHRTANIEPTLQLEVEEATPELDYETQDYNIANCILNSSSLDDADSLNYSIESSSFLQLESRWKLANNRNKDGSKTQKIMIFAKPSFNQMFANVTCQAITLPNELVPSNKNLLKRGYPDSTLVYFDANGTELSNESDSNSGVNITTSGTYECSAFNAVGMDSKAIKISSGGLGLTKENVHVMKPTKKLILEASSVFDYPLQVNWRHNLDYLPRTLHQEEIELLPDGRVKTTSKLRVSSDDNLTLKEGGLYEAEFIIGLNGSHYISNQRFDVKVEVPPKRENIKIEASPSVGQIARGENVKVSCRYEFDEDHLIQPSTHLNDGEEDLVIEKLESPVEITCLAKNTAGKASAKMILIPNSPPEITSLDFDTNKNIVCNATGFPEPTVTIQLPNGTSRNENTIAKSKTSSGIYRCTASNLLGQASVIRQIDPFDAAAIALVVSATAAFVLLIVLLSHKLSPIKMPGARCGTMDIPQEHRPSESYRQRRSAEPIAHQIPQKYIISSSSSGSSDPDSPQVVVLQPPSF